MIPINIWLVEDDTGYRRALQEMARQQAVNQTGLDEIEIGLRGNGK